VQVATGDKTFTKLILQEKRQRPAWQCLQSTLSEIHHQLVYFTIIENLICLKAKFQQQQST